MADSVAAPCGASRVAGSARSLGRCSRGASPMRASSPARARQASPMQAHAFREAALNPVLAPPKGQSTSSPFHTRRFNEGMAPTLRRSQGLFTRQPLGGPPVHRPVNTSVRPFPGPSREEDTATDGPGPAVATVTTPEAQVPSSAEVKSSLDRVETQARESLAKLKHLLYKLRTRKEEDVKSTLLATPSYSGGEGASTTGSGSGSSTAAVVEDNQQIFVSQKIEVDLSKPEDSSFAAGEAGARGFQSEAGAGPSASTGGASKLRDIDLASLKGGLEIQLDALTATRATVTFDDATQTAIVTLTATVRAAELEDKGSFSEKAIATAVKALARTCLELDEKAQASAAAASSAALMSPPGVAKPVSLPTVQADSPSHQRVQRDLLSGSVVSWEVAPAEFGSTPFRPVFAVKLQRLDGTLVEALFKPTMPGDKTLRWKRAPEDWVAYQLASVLGIDVVPPAVIRSGVTLGKRRFDLGVMILKPTSVVRLESTDPSEATLTGSSSPQALVADIRVLDALLGNALRQKEAFLAARGHWADRKDSSAQEAAQQRLHPVVIGQALGPHLGNALHCMWTANARSAPPCAVQVTSKSTMAKLKGLSRAMLMEVFGGVLSEEEIERMLAKRDHVVAYFDGLSRKVGLANVFV